MKQTNENLVSISSLFNTQNAKENSRENSNKKDDSTAWVKHDLNQMQGAGRFMVSHISAKKNDFFRTVNAKFCNQYDEENVCRTTITIPNSDCLYIEYRETPYRDYGRKQERPWSLKWSIGFVSNEKAHTFQDLLYKDQIICDRQEKFNNDYQKSGKRIALACNNILLIEAELQHILKLLSDNNPLMQQAVELQNETWEEFLMEMENPNFRPR